MIEEKTILKEDFTKLQISYYHKTKELENLNTEYLRVLEDREKTNYLIKKILKANKIPVVEDVDQLSERDLLPKNKSSEKTINYYKGIQKLRDNLYIDALISQVYGIKQILLKNQEEMELLKATSNHGNNVCELQSNYLKLLDECHRLKKENSSLKLNHEEITFKLREISDQRDFYKMHYEKFKLKASEECEHIQNNDRNTIETCLSLDFDFEKDKNSKDENRKQPDFLVGSIISTSSTKDKKHNYSISVVECDTQDDFVNNTFFIKDNTPREERKPKTEGAKQELKRTSTVERVLTEKLRSSTNFDEIINDPYLINFVK